MVGFLSSIKVYLIIGAIFLAMLGLGYWYYQDSQKRISTLVESNAKLQIAIDLQEGAIKSLQQDAKLQAEILTRTYDQFNDARGMVQDLQDKLARHELGALAVQKPELVENLINKGTANANRCIAILSGCPLTKAEKSATKKSEINTECPSIANPKYINQ